VTWPTGGTSGWENFGTDLAGDPEVWLLPVAERALYYDPSPLGGVGRVLEQGVHTFGGATVVARGRGVSVEVEFLQPNVYGVHLMDWFIWDPSEPCAITLDVYEDDRETIAWSVGTSIGHAHPYLVNPEQYAEQEIDVASGAATVGTVTVTVIDPAREPGDQDSGWMTRLLGYAGYGDLAGRRARLRRFISEDLGYVVIADGPIGTPRMEPDYASFAFDIRDTRETERKVQIFKGGGGVIAVAPGEPFDPTGVKTLLPDSVWGGYGYDPVNSTYLIDPAAPVLGRAEIGMIAGVTTNPNMVSVNLQSTPGNANALIDITNAAYNAGQGLLRFLNDWYEYGGILRRDYRVTFPNLTLLWREQGSLDPWTDVTGTLWIDGYQEDDGFTTTGTQDNVFLGTGGAATGFRRVGSVVFGDSRGSPFCPADNQDIELVVIYRGPPTEDLPVYVEGLTAGEFARNVYAGLYSARDFEGFLVPTGIRYDEAALLEMTDVVRLRFKEVINDARDWLEKYIFAPTGWVPALDHLGQISPVSQVAPSSPFGLTSISNAITEPSPDWNAGERVINVLRFVYPRDYKPAAGETDNDGLLSRSIEIEYVDQDSVDRFGRQVHEIKGDAFRAIGLANSDPITNVGEELSWQLANLRQLHVQNRFAFGAPAISVAVMREATLTLRAGSWVTLNLTWIPDYVTRKRGLIAMAQVVSMGDLDCAWRRVLLEVVIPLPEGSGS
jgi:hypothetical protein